MVDSICTFDASKELDFYKLLGCHETSTVEQINTEFKLKARKEHPDKNVDEENFSAENFQQLLLAKEVLTDETKRADYDKWRRSGMAMSYKQWCSLGDSVKMTMHWASKPKTKPMLMAEKTSPIDDCKPAVVTTDKAKHVIGDVVWQRQQGNDLLKKFRNYEL